MVADRDLTENSNYALDRIRELLVPGRLGPDGRLPTERALSDMLGVGRRSVRRALEVLEAEGRIWRRQGSGTFAGSGPVQTATQDPQRLAAETNFMEVMEVRLRLEPPLAQLAALRAGAEEVARMRAILAHLDASTDSDGRELWDSTFHRTVAASAGNRLYMALFDLIDRVRQDPAWVNIRERARSASSIARASAQHKAIVDAIEAKDPLKAGEEMRGHLMALQENLIHQTSLGFIDAL